MSFGGSLLARWGLIHKMYVLHHDGFIGKGLHGYLCGDFAVRCAFVCLHAFSPHSLKSSGRASSTLGMFGLFVCWVLHGLLEQGGSFLLSLTGNGSRACFCGHSGGEYGILDCLKEWGTRGLYMLMWCTVADLQWGCPS
jgi:hypothetical protein